MAKCFICGNEAKHSETINVVTCECDCCGSYAYEKNFLTTYEYYFSVNNYLNMIRGNVVLLRTTSVSEMFEQMIRIDEKDAVIGISFPRYSMRTLKAMEFATDRNAKVISITDNVHSPMCLYSSCNLFARSDMVSIVDSLVAPLSVINALVVALCLRVPEEVKKNLEMLENTWNNYQVYLNDEINFIDEEPMLNYPLVKEHSVE